MSLRQLLAPLLVCVVCALAGQAPALAGQTSGGHAGHAKNAHPARVRTRARVCSRSRHRCPKRQVKSRRHAGEKGGGAQKKSAPAAPSTDPLSGLPLDPAPALGLPQSGTSSDGGAAPPTTSSPGTPAPARVQVTAKEYSFTLSRPEVPAGPVIIEFVNAGEDVHNMHLYAPDSQAQAGPEVGAFPNTEPTKHEDLAFNMPAGTYTLLCTLHIAEGMKASLKVS